ncbi:hypothetical protein KSP40_PGU014072 [Platanthera guangdongensis]|uniref:Uncharacterized protein n=1 Tax=Platanthera guangdongensis TaxID=2320717 RepID=A0ABR2MGH4_9ASPA
MIPSAINSPKPSRQPYRQPPPRKLPPHHMIAIPRPETRSCDDAARDLTPKFVSTRGWPHGVVHSKFMNLLDEEKVILGEEDDDSDFETIPSKKEKRRMVEFAALDVVDKKLGYESKINEKNSIRIKEKNLLRKIIVEMKNVRSEEKAGHSLNLKVEAVQFDEGWRGLEDRLKAFIKEEVEKLKNFCEARFKTLQRELNQSLGIVGMLVKREALSIMIHFQAVFIGSSYVLTGIGSGPSRRKSLFPEEGTVRFTRTQKFSLHYIHSADPGEALMSCAWVDSPPPPPPSLRRRIHSLAFPASISLPTHSLSFTRCRTSLLVVSSSTSFSEFTPVLYIFCAIRSDVFIRFQGFLNERGEEQIVAREVRFRPQ